MKTRKFVILALSLGLTGCKTSSVFEGFARKEPDKASTFAQESVHPRADQASVSNAQLARASHTSESAGEKVALGQQEVAAWYQDGRETHLETASNYFSQALRNDPRSADAHHGLAIVADLQKNYRSAEQHYRQALASSPNNSQMLGDLGYSYLLQGRLKEAEQTLNQALGADPGNKNAIKHLGDVYAQQGQSQLAESMYRRVLNETEVKQALAANVPAAGAGDDKQTPAGEKTGEEKTLLSRLLPKREQESDLTADIKRQMAEAQAASQRQRQGAATSSAASGGIPAWAEGQSPSSQVAAGVPAGEQLSDAELLKYRLAQIEREKQSRIPSGPLVIDPAAGTAAPVSSPPAAGNWPTGTTAGPTPAGPVSSTPQSQAPVVMTGAGQPPAQSPPHPPTWATGYDSAYTSTSASPVTRPWGEVAPVAAANTPQSIDQAYYQNPATPGRGPSQPITQAQASIGRPGELPPAAPGMSNSSAGARSTLNGSPPQNPSFGLPGNSPTGLSASDIGGQDAYAEAARAAARLGMGFGSASSAVVTGQTARASAGTASTWNGLDYSSPARMLPTDLPPQDLQQAFAPQAGANMAPTAEAHGQYPAVTPPLRTPEQFGTASRYQWDQQNPNPNNLAPPATPSLDQYNVQRQQADGQLNQAMQQAWQRPNVNTVSPAGGLAPTDAAAVPAPWPYRPVSADPYAMQPASSASPTQSPAGYGRDVVVPPPYGGASQATAPQNANYSTPYYSTQPGTGAQYFAPAQQSQLPRIVPSL